jgi:hypothetical protein
MSVRDPVKARAKAKASDTLKNVADDWADGRISTAKRDAVRQSAKDAIKGAKMPTRVWDGEKVKRGLV